MLKRSPPLLEAWIEIDAFICGVHLFSGRLLCWRRGLK